MMITRFHFDVLLGGELSDIVRPFSAVFGGSKGHNLEPLTVVVKHSSVRCDRVPWTVEWS